jgi:hypothetical protein
MRRVSKCHDSNRLVVLGGNDKSPNRCCRSAVSPDVLAPAISLRMV